MISSVLRNLSSNAIKYCNKGDKIYLSLEKEGGFLRISVRDTGLGISEDVQKKLFRLDCHYTTTGTANELGTGLGLILCREFVEKNGGSLNLESLKGEGSTFSFTVPVSD
jgi:two-component system sensor histidine kinase/response regulator